MIRAHLDGNVPVCVIQKWDRVTRAPAAWIKVATAAYTGSLFIDNFLWIPVSISDILVIDFAPDYFSDAVVKPNLSCSFCGRVDISVIL